MLTKSDKLKRGPAKAALLKVTKELEGAASVQLFSSLKKDGTSEARQVLDKFLAQAESSVVANQTEKPI